MISVPSGLYGITDSQLMPDTEQLLYAIESALKGGMQLLQYRDKSGDKVSRLKQAQALQALCSRYQVPLLINDDIELALNVGAAGVHLGQQDTSLVEARKRLGPHALIGVTCHNRLDLAEQAVQDGASYLAFGRFFSSQTKPLAAPADPSILQQAKQQFSLPVVAIGGITLERAPALINQGADLLAVVHNLFNAPDIEAQAHAFQACFATSTSPQQIK